MRRAVCVDTWGWVALGNRRDSRHQEVRNFYKQLRQQGALVLTSDFILDEAITLLFRRASFPEATRFFEGIFAVSEKGLLTVERITSGRFAEAWKLRQRFHDKPRISFTDLATMALMKELGVKEIMTEDDHFTQVGMGFQKVP